LKKINEHQVTIEQLVQNNKQLKNEILELKEEAVRRISYQSFEVGDSALFIRNDRLVYQAFHKNLPHRYLGEENKGQFSGLNAIVIGRIVLIEQHKATEQNNPYGLALGTDFYKLFVEIREHSQTPVPVTPVPVTPAQPVKKP